MLSIQLVLIVLAFLCLVLASLGVPSKHVSLGWLGLALWMLTLLVR